MTLAHDYEPSLSPDEIERIRRWHERAYRELCDRQTEELEYLGLRLVVPRGVFPPTATSDLLGRAVRDEVRAADRVLDVGTGSGVNAILAASRAQDVLGVDINPLAVACARANAARNGAGERARFIESDVFDRVSGAFDLVICDPPFRWWRARDAIEAAITDAGYATLRRFISNLPARLRPGGRALMFFGTSGDLGYLFSLIDAAGFEREILERRSLEKEGHVVHYSSFRLTRPASGDPQG